MEEEVYVRGSTFSGVHYGEQPLARGEYEQCRFEAGVFHQVDLSRFSFVDCTFVDCDFSMAKLHKCAFQDVRFHGCKLLGLHFDQCNPFLLAFQFIDCQLNYASFYRLNLKGTHFKGCTLEGTELIEADLSEAVFEACNLRGAVFEQTNLEAADLRSAYGFSIDPTQNRLRKARFSADNLMGLVEQLGIVVE